MERGLRSQLKIYDDFSMLTPEQMEELLDKINATGCKKFLVRRFTKTKSRNMGKRNT